MTELSNLSPEFASDSADSQPASTYHSNLKELNTNPIVQDSLIEIPSSSEITAETLDWKELLEDELTKSMTVIEGLKGELESYKEKLNAKKDKVKELSAIITQLLKNKADSQDAATSRSSSDQREVIGFKTPVGKLGHIKALSVERTHGRTESSSGGQNDNVSKVDHARRLEEITSPVRIKEENEDLISKLRCARDTVAALNEQVTTREREFAEAKLAWNKREQDLLKEIEALAHENDNLKNTCKNHAKELREQRANYENLEKVYKLEEYRARRNMDVIVDLQTKLGSIQTGNGRPRTPSGSRALTVRATEGPEALRITRSDQIFSPAEEVKLTRAGERSEGKIKSSRSTINGLKIPQVKPIAKGMLYNPLRNFFA